MQERIAVRNETMEKLAFEVSLELAADFADIISVKQYDFAFGDPETARRAPPAAPATHDPAGSSILIQDPGGELRTRVTSSQAGRFADGALSFPLALEPSERWDLSVEFLPARDDAELAAAEDLDEERETLGDSAAAWTLRVPKCARRLGEPSARVRPFGRRPRRAAHADRRVPAAALRRGDALVHDRLRA